MENIKQSHLIWIAILLLFPALLYKLGELNIFFGVDEATRAIVSLEMMLRDSYLLSTINGELYAKKPPLYNWIIVIFYKFFGYSQFVFRLPNVISLIAFAGSIYYFNKKYLGNFHAVILGLMIICCGRVLFWESYFGYIDILFSLVVYTSLQAMYKFYFDKKYWALYLITYGLTLIAFMLKGFPSIVFQGLSLFALLIWKRDWRSIFNVPHIVSGFLFLGVLFFYYWTVSTGGGFFDILSTLWTESVQRAGTNFTFAHTLKHVFSFPFEMFFHYLPWTLLIPFMFLRSSRALIGSNTYLQYSLIIFLSNVIVYWISPSVYPKYILMLIPFIYCVAYKCFLESENRFQKYFIGLTKVILFALPLVPIVFCFIKGMDHVSMKPVKLLVAGVLLSLSAFVGIRKSKYAIMCLLISMLLLRFLHVEFIWLKRDDGLKIFEKDAVEIAKIVQSEKVFYLDWQPVQHANSFRLTKLTNQIIGIERASAKPGVFYLVKNGIGLEKPHKVYYEYKDVQKKEEVVLVKFE